MYYTTINANKEQAQKLFKKCCKPWFGFISKRYLTEYKYDSQDYLGFVTIYLLNGKKIEYQMRMQESKPCFIMFSGFGSIRYYVDAEDLCPEMYKVLQKWGTDAVKKFWAGGCI